MEGVLVSKLHTPIKDGMPRRPPLAGWVWVHAKVLIASILVLLAREQMPRYTDLLPSLDLKIYRLHLVCGTRAAVHLVQVQIDRQVAIGDHGQLPFFNTFAALLGFSPYRPPCSLLGKKHTAT